MARASAQDISIPAEQIQAVAERLGEYHPDRGKRARICEDVRRYGPQALGVIAMATGFDELGALAAREISNVVFAGLLPRSTHKALVAVSDAG